MEYKYDVFISYSRRDFVDDDKNIIPGNPISAITDAFDQNDITYWIDREGIKSGQQFRDEITDAIAKSKVLLFVSSCNSNESKYVKSEVLYAYYKDKDIIPFRIDDCEYDRSVEFELIPLDFIEYYSDKEGAIKKLIRSVNSYKKEIAEKEKKKQLESQKAEIKARIKAFEDDYRLSADRHEVALKDIQELYAKLGITTKECPVCDKKVSIGDTFCERCGWYFPPLLNSPVDRKRLNIIKANWKILQAATNSKDNIKALENEIYDLREKLNKVESEKADNLKTISEHAKVTEQLKAQLLELESKNKVLNQKCKTLSEQSNTSDQKLKDLKVIADEVDRQMKLIMLTDPRWVDEHIMPLASKDKGRHPVDTDDSYVLDMSRLVTILGEYGLAIDKSYLIMGFTVKGVIDRIVKSASKIVPTNKNYINLLKKLAKLFGTE